MAKRHTARHAAHARRASDDRHRPTIFNEDGDPGTDSSSSAVRTRTRRTVILCIAAALVIVIAATSGGIYWHHTSQLHAEALAQCASARKQLDSGLGKLNTALNAAQPVAQTKAASVDDPQTLTTLASAITTSSNTAEQYKASNSRYQCDATASMATLRDSAAAIVTAGRDAERQTATITDNANAVTRSQANKTNAGIRYTLKAAISQSRGWISQTANGKVTDETTRTTLQQRVDTAQQLIDGPEIVTDSARYQTAIDQLNDGMDKVAASNIAKLGVDCAKEQCVALTFDDGPNAQNTPPVIEALRKTGTVATFFNCGGVIDANAPLIRQLHDMGNPIENHTWNHPHLQTLSRADVHTQLTQTSEKIEQTVGVYPSMIRPPYSEWSNDVRDEAVAMNSSIINFDVMGYDWERNATQVHDAVLTWTRGGSIVLLHDLQGSTAQAIESIITDLKARGFVFVTIPQLLGYNPKPGYVYYSQHTVVKPGEPWRPSSYFSDQW